MSGTPPVHGTPPAALPSEGEQFERNEMQMVEVLMTRLKNLSAKVGERKKAAIDDKNADSALCSSLVTPLAGDLEDDGEDSRLDRRPSVFRPRNGSKDGNNASLSRSPSRSSRASYARPDAPGGTLPPTQGEIYVTFRSAPGTDLGKRLEHKFEIEMLGLGGDSKDGGGAGGTNRFAGADGQVNSRRPSRVGSRQRAESRRVDEKKAERARYEKKLLENLEAFVIRGVTDQKYKMPPAAKLAAGGALGTAPFRSPSFGNGRGGQGGFPRDALSGNTSQDEDDASTGKMQRTTRMKSPTSFFGTQGQHGEPVSPSSPDGKALDAHSMSAEAWPIPVGAGELNPRLLLGLAAVRASLPAGEGLFKHFVLCQKACWLFVYMYWFCHCKYFQADSEPEQEHLLRRASAIYVQLLASPKLGPHKDFFFKYFPTVLAHAIGSAFYFLCPGSRHLYTPPFKRILYLQCCQVLGGVEKPVPAAVLVMRDALYPEEAAEDALHTSKERAKQAQLANAAREMGQAPAEVGTEDDLPPLPASHASGGSLRKGSAAGGTPHDTEEDEDLADEDLAGEDLGGEGGGGEGSRRSSRSAPQVVEFGGSGQLVAKSKGAQGGNMGFVGGGMRRRSTGATAAAAGAGGGAGGGGGVGLSGVAAIDEHWRCVRAQALQPLKRLTGGRHSVKFNRQQPPGLRQKLPRQTQGRFDSAAISPMVQQYLEHPDPYIKGGRRPERVRRTDPVGWCKTGGAETHEKQQNRNILHEAIRLEHQAAREAFRAEEAVKRREFLASLRELEAERKAVYRGGAVSVGRYSLDLVTEIQGRASEGARKRTEKATAKEKAREADEKKRQQKALQAQERLKLKEEEKAARAAAAGVAT